MKKTIVLATHNQGKIRELKDVLLPLGYEAVAIHDILPDLIEPEETGKTFEENAFLKASYYMKASGLPCLADDSGIMIDVLDGRPGVYSARYAGEQASDEDNNQKLIRELADVPYEARTGRYVCVLVCCFPDGQVIRSEGTCEGIIRDYYAGNGGFGYDPLFFLPSLNKTMAEITMDEKNSISHRGKAICKLVELLR